MQKTEFSKKNKQHDILCILKNKRVTESRQEPVLRKLDNLSDDSKKKKKKKKKKKINKNNESRDGVLKRLVVIWASVKACRFYKHEIQQE